MFGKKEKETKEEKQERKTQEFLQKWGLDGLNDPVTIQNVKHLTGRLAGNGFTEAGYMLGAGSEKDILKSLFYMQRSVIEQNMIIIRLLDKIANK